MSRVEGDRGIADPVVGIRRVVVRGDAGQVPGGPGAAPVRGCRKGDVRGAPVEEAARLKRRDDGVAGGERVGLDLGLVLTRGIGVRVVADLDQRHAGKGDQPERCAGHERHRDGDEESGSQTGPIVTFHVQLLLPVAAVRAFGAAVRGEFTRFAAAGRVQSH